jgi:iron complex transport system ATP-binding protein
MTALQIQNLWVRRQGHAILQGIMLAVEAQQVHFIIGRNGSGKTTLLRCLARAIPFEGDIWLHHRPLRRFNAHQLAHQLAWVPQDILAYPQLTTYQYVLLGRFPHLAWLGNYRREDHAITRAALTRLGIEQLSERKLSLLSGGERQKAAIARALTQQTPLIILDEPDQSLDPLARRELSQLLFALAQQEGKTILCTTHDLTPLAAVEAQVIGLREGKVVWRSPGGQDEEQLLQAVYGSEGG